MREFWDAMRRTCGFDSEAEALVRSCGDLIRPHVPGIVEGFYETLDGMEPTHAILARRGDRDRLVGALSTWLLELFAGPHDEAYLERRLRIGRRHLEVGLPQRLMFVGMAVFRASITRVLAESGRADVTAAIEAVGKLLDLELAVMLETFAESRLRLGREAERTAAFAEALSLERSLHRVDEQINRLVTNDDALEGVCREFSTATGFEIVVASRADAGSAAPTWIAHVGIQRDSLDAVERGGRVDALSAWVAKSSESLYLDDAMQDARARGTALGILKTRTFLCLPVRSGTEVLGTLSFASRRPIDVDETRIGILQASADHLGSAWKTRLLLAYEANARRIETVARFSRVLAHEVRNPLNSMSLQAALMRRRLGGVPAAARKELEGALVAFEKETNRLNELVEHYLLIGKAGQLRRERARLSDLVRNVVRLHDQTLAEAGISVDLELVDDVTLDIDTAKVAQILHNLIRNSIEAMQGGGELEVCTRRADGVVQVSVRDTGPGVADPDVVFEPFFTTKSLGTGLGLPVAREIARAHGGDLELRSGRDAGAEFVLTLPVS